MHKLVLPYSSLPELDHLTKSLLSSRSAKSKGSRFVVETYLASPNRLQAPSCQYASLNSKHGPWQSQLCKNGLASWIHGHRPKPIIPRRQAFRRRSVPPQLDTGHRSADHIWSLWTFNWCLLNWVCLWDYTNQKQRRRWTLPLDLIFFLYSTFKTFVLLVVLGFWGLIRW